MLIKKRQLGSLHEPQSLKNWRSFAIIECFISTQPGKYERHHSTTFRIVINKNSFNKLQEIVKVFDSKRRPLSVACNPESDKFLKRRVDFNSY